MFARELFTDASGLATPYIPACDYDPLMLTYYFSLENDKIIRLIISANKPGY